MDHPSINGIAVILLGIITVWIIRGAWRQAKVGARLLLAAAVVLTAVIAIGATALTNYIH